MNDSIEEKLDIINQKLTIIADQLAVQARRDREMQELKDDLNRVAADMFQSAVVELDQVSANFDIQDLLFLLKRILRNVRNLSKMLEQIESVVDLSRDLVPIGNQAYLNILAKLDEWDQKGYFDFVGESLKIVDKVLTLFTVEDLRQLHDSIVPIVNTIKNLAQPERVMALNNALTAYKNLGIDREKKISYWNLWQEAKQPEIRQGLVFALHFLRNLVTLSTPNTQQSKGGS